MRNLFIVIFFTLFFSQELKAQIVTGNASVNYIQDSLHAKFTQWYESSQQLVLPSNIVSRLDSFYAKNQVSIRLQSKLNTELQMCFNTTIPQKDRLWLIDRLLMDFKNAPNEFPLFLIQEEKLQILKDN